MAKFIALVGFVGPIPADWIDQPGSSPADMGLPTEDDGSRNDILFGQTFVGTAHYQFDFDALQAASTRIVVAAGEESEGILASRAAFAIAERLGTPVAVFPSHHGGFMGGEYGQAGKPEEFATKLREVLAEQAA